MFCLICNLIFTSLILFNNFIVYILYNPTAQNTWGGGLVIHYQNIKYTVVNINLGY